MLTIKDIFPIMKQQYPQSGGKKTKQKVKKRINQKALDGVESYFKNKKKNK